MKNIYPYIRKASALALICVFWFVPMNALAQTKPDRKLTSPKTVATQPVERAKAVDKVVKTQDALKEAVGVGPVQPIEKMSVTCWDGSKAASQARCPDSTITCWDGSKIPYDAVCPPEPVDCGNGVHVTPPDTCPTQVTCPNGVTVPPGVSCPQDTRVECRDGRIVAKQSDCSIRSPDKCWDESAMGANGECPPKLRCKDGSFVADIAACPKKKRNGGGFSININLNNVLSDLTDVKCWDGSKAPNEADCPRDTRVTCWNGTQVTPPETCPPELTFTCWNGSKVQAENQCPPPPPHICWNGSQAGNAAACPPRLICWDGSSVTDLTLCPKQSFECWQGSVVDDVAKCPPQRTCWDGSFVTDLAACPIQPPETVTCWNGVEAANAQSCPPRLTCPDGTFVTDFAACPKNIPDPDPEPSSVTCWNGATVINASACPPRLLCWDGSYAADRNNCPVNPADKVICWNDVKAANRAACPVKITCPDGSYATNINLCPESNEDVSINGDPLGIGEPDEPRGNGWMLGALGGLVVGGAAVGLLSRRRRQEPALPPDVTPAKTSHDIAPDPKPDPAPEKFSAAWFAALALLAKEDAQRGMVFGPSAMTAGALASIPLALRPAYKATGRIGYEQVGKPTGEEIAYGTGVLITDRHIMTNRHVWEMYGEYLVTGAEIDNPGIEFVAEKDSDKSDFVRFDGQPPQFFPGLDVAIFTLAGEPHANRVPITFAAETPETLETQEIAVIGYPQAREVTDEIAEVVEDNAIFGVKRISEGQVFRHSTTEDTLYGVEAPVRESINQHGKLTAVCHNASTLGGSSGSCVVDKKTGEMIAIHFGFDVAFNWEEAANFAIPAADIIPHLKGLE